MIAPLNLLQWNDLIRFLLLWVELLASLHLAILHFEIRRFINTNANHQAMLGI